MLITAATDYCAGLLMHRSTCDNIRKSILITAISINIFMLGLFKYKDFLISNVLLIINKANLYLGLNFDSEQLSGLLFLKSKSIWVIPPAISFYTFESMSYSIDVYQRKTEPETNYWRYFCFICFFPHLMAGPIVRAKQFLSQLGSNLISLRTGKEFQAAVFLICCGLIKKTVVGDLLGGYVDPLFNRWNELGLYDAWAAVLGFGYQIYFDFSGYSDIALGIAALFGVSLPMNFNSPYSAINPSDFWRRWHITLSNWFRDYLYIPSGGSHFGEWRTYRNLILTMVLVGLWHGASWHFIFWGLYHSILLIAYHRYPWIWDSLPRKIGIAVMFILSMTGWVLFRADNMTEAFGILGSLVGFNGAWGPNSIIMMNINLLIMVTGISIFVHLPSPNSNQIKFDSWKISMSAGLGILTILALSLIRENRHFIYFVF